MSDEVIKHFNRGTVWGRVDGVPEEHLSNEGKGKPFYRLKVICASHRGNAFAFGRIWDVGKGMALIDYLKRNASAGVKLVGWLSQYNHTKNNKAERRSNFTWHDWMPDKCEDSRAAFSLTGLVTDVDGDVLSLTVKREGSNAEEFKIHALDPSASMRRIADGDVVQVKGYLRSRHGEDEFGDTDSSPILPYFADSDLKIRKQGGNKF